MAVLFHENPGNVNWEQLRKDLTDDEFHNGRTTHQLKLSFENSQLQAYANDEAGVLVPQEPSLMV